ncbi:MAG: DUF3365 domain-containing protein [Salibacteraceae bacterium]
MIKSVFPIAAIAMIMLSCSNQGNKETHAKSSYSYGLEAGKELYKSNCFSCHNEHTAPSARLAPTMAEVKAAYNLKNEDAFIKNMTAFIKNPTENTAKLPEAVERYGLMPVMKYKDEDLNNMVHYIFNESFSSDSDVSRKEKTLSQMSPAEKGMHYASTTKSVLGKNLMKALKEKGTIGALEFCNTQAMPLTDSMNSLHNVTIKRVSDRPRNKKNKANEEELEAIAFFKEEVKKGNQLKYIIHESEAAYRFYNPIVSNGMCLQCHGTIGKELTPETNAAIKKRYPSDQATGYGSGEIRGIFSVIFPK